MATSTRSARLRVINNNVDLGGGKSLPIGDYSGSITDMIIMMRGKEIRQVSRASIYLSEDFLQRIGFAANPSSTRDGIEEDFTPSFLKGDIIEV